MTFAGLQKTTLLDYPGKVAATLFTSGCNFRCPFCHNGELALGRSDEMSEEEVLSFLKKRVGILDGLCVTGGEPLIHAGLPEFLKKVKALGYAVKLDTNGSFPERLREICEKGLCDYVAMDIKNSPGLYSETAGVPVDIGKIKESIAFLEKCGIDHEFRTTVAGGLHTEGSVREAAEMIEGTEKYFLQAFRSEKTLCGYDLFELGKEEIGKMADAALKHVKKCEIRGI